MKKLGLLILVMFVAVALVSTAIYAWFSSGGMPSDSFVQYTGEVDLNVALFRGIDINRDGKLDTNYDENNNHIYEKAGTDPVTGLPVQKSPRNQITKYLYEEIDRIEGATYEEYISGTSILLKLAVENPNSSDSDAQIALCFSNLSNYFFESQGLSELQITQILKTYTARIMFKIEGITARTYKQSGAGGNFVMGYNTLTGSSVSSEQVENIRQINTLNSYGKTSLYLWEVSESQKFVENIKVKKGEMLEIDFKLSCMQTEEIYNNYSAYWQNYILAHPSLTEEEILFINTMSRRELAYLVSDDTENVELNFTINKLYVYGEQMPSE